MVQCCFMSVHLWDFVLLFSFLCHTSNWNMLCSFFVDQTLKLTTTAVKRWTVWERTVLFGEQTLNSLYGTVLGENGTLLSRRNALRLSTNGSRFGPRWERTIWPRFQILHFGAFDSYKTIGGKRSLAEIKVRI